MKPSAMQAVAALISGVIFGLGLAIAQMTDPNKVLSFLNLTEGWDPSLLLVLISALLVSTIGFRLGDKSKPVLDTKYYLPTKTSIDGRLLTGAALFGLGWGLSGFCPGPAIAATATGSISIIAFVGAMIIGGKLADYA